MIFTYHGIFGFDISTYQDSPAISGNVDFRKMADYGASFVIVKAGQGNWIDPDFLTSWHNSKGILPRASYWYYDNHYDPKAQARKYWDIIKIDPEGMCWLDLEDRSGGAYWDWRCWYDFIEEFKRVSGLPYERIGIYTGHYYWTDSTPSASTAQLSYFAKFPLWLAGYGVKGSDPLHPNYGLLMCPAPWLSPLILQTGTPAIGQAAGVESLDIDYDQLNGGAAEFERIFGAMPQPPQEETNMSQWYRVTAPDGLNVRTGPGSAYPKTTEIDPLAYNERIETSTAPLGGWYKIAQVYRNNGDLQPLGTDAWCSGAYLVVTTAPVEPPVAPPAGPTLTHTITVFSDGSVKVDGNPV
jgi:hypothetical protein